MKKSFWPILNFVSGLIFILAIAKLISVSAHHDEVQNAYHAWFAHHLTDYSIIFKDKETWAIQSFLSFFSFVFSITNANILYLGRLISLLSICCILISVFKIGSILSSRRFFNLFLLFWSPFLFMRHSFIPRSEVLALPLIVISMFFYFQRKINFISIACITLAAIFWPYMSAFCILFLIIQFFYKKIKCIHLLFFLLTFSLFAINWNSPLITYELFFPSQITTPFWNMFQFSHHPAIFINFFLLACSFSLLFRYHPFHLIFLSVVHNASMINLILNPRPLPYDFILPTTMGILFLSSFLLEYHIFFKRYSLLTGFVLSLPWAGLFIHKWMLTKGFEKSIEHEVSLSQNELISYGLFNKLNSNHNLFDQVRFKNKFCRMFKGEKVLLTPYFHPICLKNSIPYWDDLKANQTRPPGEKIKSVFTGHELAPPAIIDHITFSHFSYEKDFIDLIKIHYLKDDTGFYLRKDLYEVFEKL